MKFVLCIIVAAAVFGHCKTGNSKGPQGVWKVRKVDVLKGPELVKTVTAGEQYWRFSGNSRVSIADSSGLQTILHIRRDPTGFSSFENGQLKDAFTFEKLSGSYMELCSRQQLAGGEYRVLYYLDKTDDSSAAEIFKDY